MVPSERMVTLFGVASLLFLIRPRRKRERSEDPQVLALVHEGPNRAALQKISREAGLALTWWECRVARKFEIAPIVIYDRELSPVHWPENIHALARKSPRPYIILLSSSIDANLSDELQRAGGCDILRTPLDREMLLGAVQRAWQLWRSLQHVRPPDAALRDDSLADGIED
jgi:FixJ family two-component response regulator